MHRSVIAIPTKAKLNVSPEPVWRLRFAALGPSLLRSKAPPKSQGNIEIQLRGGLSEALTCEQSPDVTPKETPHLIPMTVAQTAPKRASEAAFLRRIGFTLGQHQVGSSAVLASHPRSLLWVVAYLLVRPCCSTSISFFNC